MNLPPSSSASTAARLGELRTNLNSVVRGKADTVELVLVALIAGGSVLIEDVPGVGKTTLAKTLAASLEMKFRRVQCTPDLLPADIFGFSVFNPLEGSFEFRPGPIFCNLLLVDEINRASPRTQSALLEAMAEGQVTVESVRHVLEPPFLVIATQNPAGYQGTFPLPESQLDRFLLQLSMDYPDAESELDILYDQAVEHPVASIAKVMTRDELVACQASARSVHVEKSVGRYIVEIVQQTRRHSRLRLGGSPRGSLMLFRAAQALALLNGRNMVLPDDVQRMAPFVLHHRIVATHAAISDSQARRDVIHEIIAQVKVPV